MLTKLAFVALMVHDTIYYCHSNACMIKNASKISLRKPEKIHETTVQSFLKDSTLSPYILYTVMNECCKSIILYHTIYNHYHGNTTLDNFYINKNLQCCLMENKEKVILTNDNKHDDYNMFFDVYQRNFIDKNPGFNKMFEMFRKSFMEKI